MPTFSLMSKQRLSTCDPRLQQLFNAVIKKVDCTIVEGHRDFERQEKAFSEGKSKLHFPRSNHNKSPSEAVDAAPYDSKIHGIPWKDTNAFVNFAKIVMETSEELGIKIRWGGDWNMNGDWKDEHFRDFPHFEIIQ